MNLTAIPPDALDRFRHAASLLTQDANSRASRLLILKEEIATLRKHGISYRSISDLLTQNGIPTSDVSVMKFCHRFLNEKRPRKPSAIGFVSGMIGWLALGRQLMMWCVLEHELTHAFVAVAFLRRVRSLTANETCGAVALDGNVNFVVSLAPYFLPTLALLWLPACILLREQYHIVAIIFLGVLLGYHAISNKQEFHPGQPDIQQSGFVFSVLFCLAASLVIFGFIAAVAASGSWSGGTEFLVDGWRAIMDWVQKYISAILDFLHSFSAIVGQTTHNG